MIGIINQGIKITFHYCSIKSFHHKIVTFCDLQKLKLKTNCIILNLKIFQIVTVFFNFYRNYMVVSTVYTCRLRVPKYRKMESTREPNLFNLDYDILSIESIVPGV